MRNEKGNILVIVLAGFLLLAIGAAGYLFWQNQQLQNVPSNQYPTNSNQVNSPTPSTQDETANWKTYTNNEFHFSLKYPDYFQFIKEYEGLGVYLAPRKGNEQAAGSPLGLTHDDLWIGIDVINNNLSASIEDFIALKEQGKFYSNSKKLKTTITNQPGYKIMQLDPSLNPEGAVTIQGIFQKGSSIYKINLESFNPELLKSNEELFDQILSTFKFLADNSKQTASTKTYVNQYYKFKIDYPGDWTAFEQNISNNPQQGNLAISSPEAAQGVLTIYWGGGFGGGPCPKERQKVQTNAGIIDMCKNVYDDGSVNLSRSNDGIGDTFDDKASPALNFTISLKSTADEQKILNVLKTFTWQ